MKPKTPHFLLTATSALLLAPAASLLVSSTAFAGNLWDGGGTAVAGLFNWSDNNNWDSNTPPAYGTLLTFGGSTGLTSNNNGATASVAGITFSSGAGAFTLSGSSVTLAGTITNSSSNTQTINLPLVLNDNRTINTTNGNITLNGPISGAFNLIKSQGNTLTMNTAGSSFNRLQINTGTVSLGINDALPTAGGLTFSTSNGTLDLNGKTQTLGGTIVIGATVAGTATIIDTAGGGLLKLGNDVSQNSGSLSNVTISAALDLNGATRSFTLGNATITFDVSGAISNSSGTAGLTKAGIGTLTLSGANTFNGNTTVGAGLLTLSNASALQNSTLDTTNSIASSNAATGLKTTVTTLTLGGLSGSKALASLFDSTNGYGSVSALELNPASGQTPSYSGVIVNGAANMTLTKKGAGTQVLTVANSYSGGTAINGGILSIGNAAALGTTGTISFGGGTLQYNGITTDLSSRFSTAVNQAYSVDTNGQTVTWAGALASSGGSLTKSGGGTLTLTGGLSNSFGGPIAVNGGTLSVTDGASLKNVTGAITVASGATLNFDQSFTANNLTNALTLSGTGDGSFGALNLTRNAVVTGGITLAADTRITKGFNNATIQDVAITGSGRNLQLTTTQANQPGLVISSAIQTGAGGVSVTGVANSGDYSVRLGGNNTFTGGLVINNGVVQLNSAGALNSTAGSENAVTFGASTTTGKLALNGRSYAISNLTSNATPGSPVVENGNATAVTLTVGNSQNLSGTYAGVIQNGTGGGALSLTKSGTGTLTLSGTNTYTGATLISGGTLRLDATGTINTTSEVSLGTVGTLDVSDKGLSGYTVGTLKGSGNVTGALTVSTQLAIGNSPGTTNFSSSLTLDSAAYVYEMTGGGAPGIGSADLGNVVGTLNITAGSVLDLVELGTYNLGNKFTLFGYGTLTGTFDGLANNANFLDDLSNTWQIKYNDTIAGANGGTGTNFITITAIPEPNTAALLGGLGLFALLRRRR